MASYKIFVTGISGVGKSTVAERLQASGFSVVDVDHVPGLCGWVNLKTGEKLAEYNTANIDADFMNQHDYQCDMEVLQDMLNRAKEPVFVFGCVGDNSDFLPLFGKVILLQCSPETLTHRLVTRNTNSFGKDQTALAQILDWRIKFDQLMLEAGAIAVDAEQPIEKVVEDVMRFI